MSKQGTPTIPDAHEEAFWGMSASKTRSRHSLVLQDNDDSLLMEGNMDMGDVSVDTFSEAPTPVPTQPKRTSIPATRLVQTYQEPTRTSAKPALQASRLSEVEVPQPLPPLPVFDLPSGADVSFTSQSNDSILDESDATFEEDAENTIVLPKPPVLPSSSPPRPSAPPPELKVNASSPQEVRPTTPIQTPFQSTAATPATGRKSKHRITSDTERIVVSPFLVD